MAVWLGIRKKKTQVATRNDATVMRAYSFTVFLLIKSNPPYCFLYLKCPAARIPGFLSQPTCLQRPSFARNAQRARSVRPPGVRAVRGKRMAPIVPGCHPSDWTAVHKPDNYITIENNIELHLKRYPKI